MASKKSSKKKKDLDRLSAMRKAPAAEPISTPRQDISTVEASGESSQSSGTVDVSSKSVEKSAYELRREQQEIEERIRSVQAVEKLHVHFLAKLGEASTSLKQAIALAVNIDAQCSRDRSNREVHLGRRIQVRDMAMFAASIDGQISKFTRKNSFRTSTQFEATKELIRTPETPEAFELIRLLRDTE